WRAVYYASSTTELGFEVRLYEGQGRFDIVYGPVPDSGGSATVGFQGGGSGPTTQFSCNTPSLSNGMLLEFDCTSSGSPLCNLSVAPGGGGPGDSFIATCTVSPGVGPPSTGLAVSLDASGVGAGTVALHDDGVAPDAAAGDNVFTAGVTVGAGATDGIKTLTSTVTDDQGRSSNCGTSFTVAGRPTTYQDLGTWTIPQNGSDPYTLGSGEVRWYRLTLPAVADPSAWLDLYTTGGGSDTMLAVYDDAGILRASDDDDGVGTLSALSFGNTSYPRNSLGSDAQPFNGRDGSLAAGTYWIALTSYPATFGVGWDVSSTGGGGGRPVAVALDLGSPVNPG
ncbi:MAG: hypothetical protein ABUL72_06925, partial [Armatimonadota bacterium]